MRETTTVPCACGCGEPVTTPDTKGRPVRYLRGHAGHGGPVTPGKQPTMITCQDCGQTKPLEGRGRCKRCYLAARRRGVFTPEAKVAAPRPEPESRLPIPPMVRCAGCPTVPRCPRGARAEVGRCWRCQQEAARAGVAA